MDEKGVAPVQRSGHPVTGIISFALGLLLAVVLVATLYSGYEPRDGPGSMACSCCAFSAVAYGAVGLGIAGVVQRRRKRLFGVIGIVLGLLVLAALFVLAVIVYLVLLAMATH